MPMGMNPFWTMEDTYNTWYLKHIKVSMFKSIKVFDFLPWVAYFLSLACKEGVVAIMPSQTTTGQIEA
jgi:hypothetical protein